MHLGQVGINNPSWCSYLKYFNRITKTLWCRTVSFRLCSTMFWTDKICAELFSAIENIYLVFYLCCPSFLGFATERHQVVRRLDFFAPLRATSFLSLIYQIGVLLCVKIQTRQMKIYLKK